MKKNKTPKNTGILKKNFKVLGIWLKFCPSLIFFVPVYILLNVARELLEVILIEDAIRLILSKASINEMFNTLIVSLIVIGVSIIFKTFYDDYYEPRCRAVYVKKMQKYLFLKVREIDMEEYDNPDFYDRFSRAFRDSQWRPYRVFKTFMDFIQNICMTLALGTFVVITDPILIIIIIGTSILYIYGITKENKINYDYWKDTSSYQRFYWYVNRTFYRHEYAAELKTTNISNLLIEKFDDNVNTLYDLHGKTFKKAFKYYLIRTISNTYLSKVGMYIYLSVRLFATGAIDSFAGLINASIKFQNNFVNIGLKYTELANHALYIDDFLWVIDYKPKIETSNGDIPESFKELDINKLDFRYAEGRRLILNELDFHINKGERIAIVGLNGAGKTTLMKLILKFYNSSNGTISYNSNNYNDLNTKELRKHISIIFQDYQIYAVSIAENILMRHVTSDDDIKLVYDCLDKVGLKEKVDSLKDGINTQMTREFDDSGEAFSGGERQRLVIARVFAQNADIYIFDEPTASLDPLAEKRINELILNAPMDKTMIVIAHRLSSVVDADLIYLLKDGKFKEIGTHEELLKLNGDYANMFNTQKHLYEKQAQKEYN